MSRVLVTVLWWPIRLLLRFWTPPASTDLLVGLGDDSAQPFFIGLGTRIKPEDKEVTYFWGITCSLDGAKEAVKNLQSKIDQYEEFRK